MTIVRSRAAGFTLLELLVVLAIIGLVVGLVVPKLQDLTGVELRSSARRLAGALRYAGDQAAVRKTPHRLAFDLQGRAYRVERLEGEVWQPDRATLGAPVQLPGQVRIAAVETRARGRQVEGEPWIVFYPKGYAERATVQLASGDSTGYTIEVRAFDPRPRIHAGALELRETDALALVPAGR